MFKVCCRATPHDAAAKILQTLLADYVNNKMSKNILNSLNRYDDLTKAERRKMARLLNKMVNKLMNKPAKKCQSLIER